MTRIPVGPRAWLLAVVAFASPAAPAAAAPAKFTVVERAVAETTLHRGTADDALGDEIVFANPLYDAQNRVEVGASRGFCLRVELGRHWQCSFTLSLREGSLVIEGDYPDEGDAEFAIVGGTGRYVAARGVLRVHARDAAHSAYDFAVDLR